MPWNGALRCRMRLNLSFSICRQDLEPENSWFRICPEWEIQVCGICNIRLKSPSPVALSPFRLSDCFSSSGLQAVVPALVARVSSPAFPAPASAGAPLGELVIL